MNEKDLRIFIDVVIDYFKQLTGEEVEMGVPYIKEGANLLLEYSGIIGISGARKGAVLLSTGVELLSELAEIIVGEKINDPGQMGDMIGEVTNTIAGNSRETFGDSFMISVPIVIRGIPEDIMFGLNPPVFAIPLKWRNHQAYLSIGLE